MSLDHRLRSQFLARSLAVTVPFNGENPFFMESKLRGLDHVYGGLREVQLRLTPDPVALILARQGRRFREARFL